MNETKYAELINADNVRRTIKRTFENTASEILAELLQNSQRAMAKHVRVTTGDGYLCYEDDGCGLKPGLDGIHQLLKIAESGFESNPTIEAQDPMGVGVHALLAHDNAYFTENDQ